MLQSLVAIISKSTICIHKLVHKIFFAVLCRSHSPPSARSTAPRCCGSACMHTPSTELQQQRQRRILLISFNCFGVPRNLAERLASNLFAWHIASSLPTHQGLPQAYACVDFDCLVAQGSGKRAVCACQRVKKSALGTLPSTPRRARQRRSEPCLDPPLLVLYIKHKTYESCFVGRQSVIHSVYRFSC